MDFKVIIETIINILSAVPRTLAFAGLVVVIGIFFGAMLAIIRIKKTPLLNQLIQIFLSYIRGVPLVVHLFIIRYSLPNAFTWLMGLVGVEYNPNDFPSFVTTLVIYSILESAVESENIRSAFISVPSNQIEAAKSIGMTHKQTLRRIVIPQALQIAVPLFLNSYLKNIKKLSLAFVVGFVDILAQTRYQAALNYRYIESYIAASLVYWILSLILQHIIDKISARFTVKY